MTVLPGSALLCPSAFHNRGIVQRFPGSCGLGVFHVSGRWLRVLMTRRGCSWGVCRAALWSFSQPAASGAGVSWRGPGRGAGRGYRPLGSGMPGSLERSRGASSCGASAPVDSCTPGSGHPVAVPGLIAGLPFGAGAIVSVLPWRRPGVRRIGGAGFHGVPPGPVPGPAWPAESGPWAGRAGQFSRGAPGAAVLLMLLIIFPGFCLWRGGWGPGDWGPGRPGAVRRRRRGNR